MSIWLVRHTTVAVAPGICYGRLDVPLAETFAVEAAEVWARLPRRIDAVWSSPAQRCLRLARLWTELPQVDERLGELNFGEWEGRAWESFHDESSEAWARDPWRRSPPGGESGEELEARVAAVRGEVVEAAQGDREIVVVTHGGVMRAWRRLSEGASREVSLRWPVPWGSVWCETVGGEPGMQPVE